MSKSLDRIHAYLPKLVEQFAAGKVDRREFLRTSTLLGLSAGAAYGLAGVAERGAVASARAATGGTARISLRITALEDPHTYTEVFTSNVARQVCDYLTRTDAQNVTHPWLLERWQASGDLKTWDLFLKKGIKWSNDEELVADHVIWNVKRWLDPKVGSSILGLMKAYMMNADGISAFSMASASIFCRRAARIISSSVRTTSR